MWGEALFWFGVCILLSVVKQLLDKMIKFLEDFNKRNGL